MTSTGSVAPVRGTAEPSVTDAAVAAPPLSPPPSGAPRRRRRWVVVAVLAGVVVLAGMAWAGSVTLRVLNARDQVLEARRIVEQRLSDVRVRDALDLAGDPELARARALLADTESTLESPLLIPARMLPIVGTQVRSADALAGAGVEVLDLTDRTLVAADELVTGFQAGDVDQLQLLDQAHRLAADYERGLAGIDLGPTDRLLPALADAHDDIALRQAELASGAADVAAVTGAMSSFLGGPGQYLVLGANNAEMRSGSGMFLMTGVLTVSDGRFGVTGVQSISDVQLPTEPVPLEEDLQARWGWLDPNATWTSLGMSPRFEVTADTAARMWEAAYGQSVDGVIAIDPPMIAAIMEAFDITVELDGRTYTPDDIVAELLHDQYLDLTEDIYQGWEVYGEAQAQRRDRLARIVGAVIAGIDFEGRDPVDIVDALRPAAQRRHLLMWSRHESVQEGWRAAGVDGSLGHDSMLLSLINRSGNKADGFIDLTAEVGIEPGPQSSEVTVAVTMENRIPDGEPRYVAGPNPRTDNVYGDYEGIVTLNVPGVATQGRVDGEGSLTVAGADGETRVIGSDVALAQGEAVTKVFRFEVPNGALDEIVIEPSARVPAVRWTVEGARVRPQPAAAIKLG